MVAPVEGGSGTTPPEFPVETLRHVYLTPFGGFSPDLQPGELGIRADALEANTDLEAKDAVTISKMGGSARIPFILKMVFKVVPVDRDMRDAWRKSLSGEAVLPHELPGVPCESARLDLARGDELLINGVLAKRIGFRIGG